MMYAVICAVMYTVICAVMCAALRALLDWMSYSIVLAPLHGMSDIHTESICPPTNERQCGVWCVVCAVILACRRMYSVIYS